MKPAVFAAVSLCMTVAFSGFPATATDTRSPKASEDPQREICISLRQVDQTLVLDDNTLIYRMRNGTYYRNTLISRCGGLFDQGNFYFQLTNPYRLCRYDAFTVFRTLTTCKLGYFEPISKAELTRLERRLIAEREAGKSKSKAED